MNPYEPSTSRPGEDVTLNRDRAFINRLRAIFYVHLLAIIGGAFVVRSNTILSDRYLELLIAIPLVLTTLACPLVMAMVVIFTKQRSLRAGCLGVTADLMLSTLQYFQWLPTVQ